jgi:DNA-binding CsgD family transcriptional regulator
MGIRGRPRYPELLTPREQDILELLRQGFSNPEIAQRLGIARETVKHHVSEILSKLEVTSRYEAAETSWRPTRPRRIVTWLTALGFAAFIPAFLKASSAKAAVLKAGLATVAIVGLTAGGAAVVKYEVEQHPSAVHTAIAAVADMTDAQPQPDAANDNTSTSASSDATSTADAHTVANINPSEVAAGADAVAVVGGSETPAPASEPPSSHNEANAPRTRATVTATATAAAAGATTSTTLTAGATPGHIVATTSATLTATPGNVITAVEGPVAPVIDEVVDTADTAVDTVETTTETVETVSAPIVDPIAETVTDTTNTPCNQLPTPGLSTSAGALGHTTGILTEGATNLLLDPSTCPQP